MTQIKQPKNKQTEVLYCLIKKGTIKLTDFNHFCGFRNFISMLMFDFDLSIKKDYVKEVSEYGNKFTNIYFKLREKDLQKAKQVYNNLNKDILNSKKNRVLYLSE